MEQYIPKSALVAEIERTQKRLNIDDIGGRSVMAWSECFKNFIDTLEVKEVDIEKEINNLGLYYDGIVLDRKELIEFAKHFFELGMMVCNKAQKGEKI